MNEMLKNQSSEVMRLTKIFKQKISKLQKSDKQQEKRLDHLSESIREEGGFKEKEYGVSLNLDVKDLEYIDDVYD
ncbi:MAG: hypothetical protein IPK55_12805 [Streptococcus sp.]|nr:hypothetical protein [Streptococcus sp.]